MRLSNESSSTEYKRRECTVGSSAEYTVGSRTSEYKSGEQIVGSRADYNVGLSTTCNVSSRTEHMS